MTRTANATQAVSETPMTFLVFEDNGGSYHWTIVADGKTLVRSAGFPSYETAEQAAWIVHDGAASASFEDHSGDQKPLRTLPVRKEPVVIP